MLSGRQRARQGRPRSDYVPAAKRRRRTGYPGAALRSSGLCGAPLRQAERERLPLEQAEREQMQELMKEHVDKNEDNDNDVRYSHSSDDDDDFHLDDDDDDDDDFDDENGNKIPNDVRVRQNLNNGTSQETELTSSDSLAWQSDQSTVNDTVNKELPEEIGDVLGTEVRNARNADTDLDHRSEEDARIEREVAATAFEPYPEPEHFGFPATASPVVFHFGALVVCCATPTLSPPAAPVVGTPSRWKLSVRLAPNTNGDANASAVAYSERLWRGAVGAPASNSPAWYWSPNIPMAHFVHESMITVLERTPLLHGENSRFARPWCRAGKNQSEYIQTPSPIRAPAIALVFRMPRKCAPSPFGSLVTAAAVWPSRLRVFRTLGRSSSKPHVESSS